MLTDGRDIEVEVHTSGTSKNRGGWGIDGNIKYLVPTRDVSSGFPCYGVSSSGDNLAAGEKMQVVLQIRESADCWDRYEVRQRVLQAMLDRVKKKSDVWLHKK